MSLTSPRTLLILLCAAVLAPVLPAKEVAKPPAEPSAAQVEFYEKKIRPLLAENCYQCHSTRAKRVKGGLLLDSRAGLWRGGESGAVVVAGDPDKSSLIRAVQYADPTLQMPPDQKLAAKGVEVLLEWVRLGAPMPPDQGAA